MRHRSVEFLPGYQVVNLPKAIVESPEEVMEPDWPHVFDALGLDRDERRLFEKGKIEKVRGKQLAKQLKWEPDRVEVVGRRLRRKLRHGPRAVPLSDFMISRRSSRALAFQERLPSGRQVWALTELGEQFFRIMVAEWPTATKNALLSKCSGRSRPKTANLAPMLEAL